MDFKTFIIKKIISHFNHTFTISSPIKLLWNISMWKSFWNLFKWFMREKSGYNFLIFWLTEKIVSGVLQRTKEIHWFVNGIRWFFGAMQLTLSIYLKQNVLLLKCCRDSCFNLVVTEQTLSSYRKPHKIVIPDICWGDLYLRFFFHRIKKTKPDME